MLVDHHGKVEAFGLHIASLVYARIILSLLGVLMATFGSLKRLGTLGTGVPLDLCMLNEA